MKIKRLLVVLGIGAAVGLGISFLGRTYGLGEGTKIALLLGCGVILFFVLLFHRLKISKKASAEASRIIPLLFEEGDAEGYIAGFTRMLETQKEDYFKELCRINLSLGYSCKGDHQGAISILEQVDRKTVKSVHEAILGLNLVMERFFLGDFSGAEQEMASWEGVFSRFREDQRIKDNIRLLDHMRAYAKSRPEHLEEYLLKRKAESGNPQLFNCLCYFVGMDQIRQGNIEEARACLAAMKENDPEVEMQLRIAALEGRLPVSVPEAAISASEV